MSLSKLLRIRSQPQPIQEPTTCHVCTSIPQRYNRHFDRCPSYIHAVMKSPFSSASLTIHPAYLTFYFTGLLLPEFWLQPTQPWWRMPLGVAFNAVIYAVLAWGVVTLLS
ncbi:membrane protein [gut metagenome]|uniref:Membrane protein n=1 Tax=gut metagenome TaxID=749906 RepID=J9FYG9_9ZZZZ